MNLAGMAKLAKGAIGADQFAEMLSILGIEASFHTIVEAERRPRSIGATG
jgi:hypothetical protein